MRVLAGHVEGVAVIGARVGRVRRARLDGIRHQAVVDEVELRHVRRLGKCCVDRALIAERPDVAGVVRRNIMDWLRITRRLLRLGGADHRWQCLIVDFDQLGCIARQFAGATGDGGDRVADVAHAPHRECVVLDVRPRRGRKLEERVCEDRDLVARERSVDTVELERLRDVDRLDPCMGVGRPDEVDVAHLVTLDVVEEDAFALDEALVLLARDVLPDEAGLDLGLLDDERLVLGDAGLAHCAAARMASTMFT